MWQRELEQGLHKMDVVERAAFKEEDMVHWKAEKAAQQEDAVARKADLA